ncbi:MAG: CBS domain-containing protein [Planctomycetes bacterium]|nr:CBS domain-containing protein [Planctomycetota bacterium]
MGENQITEQLDHAEMRGYVRALLEDVHALERMLAEGLFETGVRRIGAEQELFLVDSNLRPKASVLQVLKALEGLPFTTELAQFNLELNLSPQSFGGDCLARLERELEDLLGQARKAAAGEDAQIVMCGILPTLEKMHLGIEWMTPIPRYYQLNRSMVAMRNGKFDAAIKGIDEFYLSHDNVMLEACNTSFQVHWQCDPDDYPRMYNIAQLVTAPLLACAVNSPVLMGNRLWHETRVALFQQSVDTRSEVMAQRGSRSRVNFGERWLQKSILEIFREDVARFRSLIAVAPEESPNEVLDRGGIPLLKALRLHNGTVYRWNRPCYGMLGGKPHLRIENRILPAGPTVADELANAAFFFGMMCALPEEFGDVRRTMSFDDAKNNLTTAARYGLHSKLRWLKGKTIATEELLLKHLVPLAEQGLRASKIDAGDIDRHFGVLRERIERGQTGSQWVLDSYTELGDQGKKKDRFRSIASAMKRHQEDGLPVARWPLATFEPTAGDPGSFRSVEQVMTSDVFTVHPEDLVDLAASLMDWEHLRYVPVEDKDGKLVGLLSWRAVLRMVSRGDADEGVPVRELMEEQPVTIGPEASTLEAIQRMREHSISCLPVVNSDGRLVGIVTEHDFMELSATLLERWLSSK